MTKSRSEFTYPAEALGVAFARGKHAAAQDVLAVLRERLPDAAKVVKIAAVLDDLVGPFDAAPLAASSPPARPDGWLDGEIDLTAFALAHPACDVKAVLRGFADWILRGSPPAWEPQWQPIETAPKDDTNVLLWWPFWVKNRPTIGWFGHRGIQQWVCPEACEGDGEPPTHWMPLPPPPSDQR